MKKANLKKYFDFNVMYDLVVLEPYTYSFHNLRKFLGESEEEILMIEKGENDSKNFNFQGKFFTYHDPLAIERVGRALYYFLGNEEKWLGFLSILERWKREYSSLMTLEATSEYIKTLSTDEDFLTAYRKWYEIYLESATVYLFTDGRYHEYSTKAISEKLNLKEGDMTESLFISKKESIFQEADREISQVRAMFKNKDKNWEIRFQSFLNRYIWLYVADTHYDLEEIVSGLKKQVETTPIPSRESEENSTHIKVPVELESVVKKLQELGFYRMELRQYWQWQDYLIHKILENFELKHNLEPYFLAFLTNEEVCDFMKNFNTDKVDQLGIKRKMRMQQVATNLESGRVSVYQTSSDINQLKDTLCEEETTKSLLTGQTAYKNKEIIVGIARVIKWTKNIREELEKFKEGEIMVATQTKPDFLPYLRKAKAIVTDEGGITSHVAIVSRELKIPSVIGTRVATSSINDGDMLEVDTEAGTVKIMKRK
jgi:phosphohistidine swiveling domain-containing protein